MVACPKPIKRSTVKRKRKAVKVANIVDVYAEVEQRDGECCRVTRLLNKFGFSARYQFGRLELAHVEGRKMGGNPDLTRDTTENTLLLFASLHQGPRSHHSGHLKIRALTDKGTDGPVCVEFYEQLPTEIR